MKVLSVFKILKFTNDCFQLIYIYILLVLRKKSISTISICAFIYIYNIFNELVRQNIDVNEHKIPSTLQKLDIWTQIKGAVPVLQVYALHPQ